MTAREVSPPAGGKDSNLATLLTWVVPGLGHLYLGRVRAAVLGFVVVEGLYLLGLGLSAGLGMNYLDPELRGPFAAMLSPELGNLGGLLFQMKRYGFSEFPRLYPDGMAFGTMLTALSGIANVVLMVQANVDARRAPVAPRARISPALFVGLAWLVPGLGHVAQRRFLRGAIVFTLLVGLFAWGSWFAEGSNLSRERHYYYWGGQFLLGLPAVVGEIAHGWQRVEHEIARVDVGLLFASIAGLLNVLALLDVYGVAEARIAPEGAPKR